ncbi:hypothetical protein JW960_22260 [candidate division KSB1 bacterium]|nr:hypothetical protein [candidate division KSB1 bacterium]
MIIDMNIRRCDICGNVIGKESTYRIATLKSDDAIRFFASEKVQLVPTWTTNRDGSLCFEICTTCQASQIYQTLHSLKLR